MPAVAKKSVPLDAWPEADRRLWQMSPTVKEWSLTHRQRIARAYGRWLKTQGIAPCSEATIRAFEAGLAAEVSDASVLSYLTDLYYALLVLRPRADWTWLRQRNYELRFRVVPKQQRTKRPRVRHARLSVPFEDWSSDEQRRWHAALAECDGLAGLKDRIAGLGRGRGRRANTGENAEHCHGQLAEELAKRPSCGAGRRPPGSWSEAYKNRIQRGYGMWLGWRKAQGLTEEEPGPDLVCDYVEHLEGPQRACAPVTVATYVEEFFLACTLLWPEADWKWLGYDVELLKSQADPRRNKAAQVIPIDELYAFAISLMEEAAKYPLTERYVIQFRDGYFLALAALRPKRVSNLISIVIGESLILDSQGGPLQLNFKKTKNGDRSSWPFPVARLGTYHALWMDRYRPILLGDRQDGGHLWVSREGEPLTSDAIWHQLRRRTGKAFPGKAIGPHMIRTCYATSFAEEDGSLLELVSLSLDHRDSSSIEYYKMISGSVAAAKSLDQELCELRTKGMVELRRRHRRRPRNVSL